LILNKGEHRFIVQCLERAGVPMDRVTLQASSFEDMPRYLAEMAANIFFIKPVFSKKASAPTKLAELLGCGVPCLTNIGVGDMAEQLAEQRCGITVSSFDTKSLDAGVDALLALMEEPDIALRCRQTAERHFSLEEGVRRYAEVYASLDLSRKNT
jgi:glycosyltransferase involved in cell wall biosynthesis